MEHANRIKKVSFGLWLPVIWFAIESSRSISRWMTVMGYQVEINYMEGSPIERALYSTFMVIGILILIKRKVNWREVIRGNAWLVALFLYMLVSIFWSDFSGISFKRWTRSFADLVMALVVLTDHDSLEATYTVLRRVLFIIIPLSIIFIKYYRNIGTAWDYLGNEMWVGVTTHKNELGQVAMIAGIYFVIEIMRNWRKWSWRSMSMWIYILLLVMTLWVLIGSPTSRSTTSMFLFIVGVILFSALHYMKSKAAYIGRYLVLGSFLIGIFYVGFQAFTDKSVVTSAVEASGRDTTLTGRTELWDDLLHIASAHPILGVGYGSFWIGNTSGLWDKHIWGPTQGHNGYIDVYLELGITGLLVFGGLMLSTYRNILNEFKQNFDFAAFRLTLLIIILCHNLTESSFLRGSVSLWFLFLLVVLNISDKTKMQWKQTALSNIRVIPNPEVQLKYSNKRPAIRNE